MNGTVPVPPIPSMTPANPFAAFDLHKVGDAPTISMPPAATVAGGIVDLLARYASGQTDPLVEIDRIRAEAYNPPTREAILSFLDTSSSVAESAARWRDGTPRPLEGIPFGVKGIIDVDRAAVTCGSHVTDARIAERDATVVSQLRAAGALPVAMLATTEFAAGSPFNPRHGVVTNPFDANRWTGGSSTGSGAAVARRLLPFALGTDTGGSIRVPSCWCGISGLKPTRGLLSTDGIAPLSWTLDHVGPMGLSATDLSLVMQATSECTPVPFRNLRLGVPDGWFCDLVDSAVLTAWTDALDVMKTLGATCIPISTTELFGDMSTNHEIGWTILSAELAASQHHNSPRRSDQDAGLVARITRGEAVSASEYLLAMSHRTALIQRLLTRWNVDLLVTPGLGGEAGYLEGLRIDINDRTFGFDIISRNTMIWDLCGFPALMLPAGQGRNGLPLGVQIIGRPFEDALCLSLGTAFQQATDHHQRQP